MNTTVQTPKYTQKEFFKIAGELGLSKWQIQTLRSNRLFPKTIRKGLGRGKGMRYFYTEESIKDLNTLIYWKKKQKTRHLQDLRWYLWLFGGWDWIWEDVRKDLLEMFPKVIPDLKDDKEIKQDINQVGSLVADCVSKSRKKLFKMSIRDIWISITPGIIVPFLMRNLREKDQLWEREPAIENIYFPDDVNKIFGDNSYEIFNYFSSNGLLSLCSWKHRLQHTDEIQANLIKDKLQVIDHEWNQNEDLMIINKILGIRQLRKLGLHRLPRAVSVCILLLLQDKSETT